MSDFGPPIRLKPGNGGTLKIKRGGTGKISNSGNAPKRFHNFVKGLRDPKKPGKHDGGTLIPKPPRAPAIWDPRDPFIVAYQAEHAAPVAPWRHEPRVVMYAPRRPRKSKQRVRKHFDFLAARRTKVILDIETRDA